MPPKRTTKKVTRSMSIKRKAAQEVQSSSCSTLISSSVDDGTCGCPSPSQTKITFKKQTKSKRKPKLSYVPKPSPTRRKRHMCPNGKLDVNLCTITAMKKEGIPLVMARKIVNYRKKHKCFVHINELMRIPGVKQETFSQLQRIVAIGSNPEELNKILKKRKPAVKSKSRAALSTPKSQTAKRKPPNILPPQYRERSPPTRSRRDLAEYWPRGSASMSSVVTISPKPNRPGRSYYNREPDGREDRSGQSPHGNTEEPTHGPSNANVRRSRSYAYEGTRREFTPPPANRAPWREHQGNRPSNNQTTTQPSRQDSICVLL